MLLWGLVNIVWTFEWSGCRFWGQLIHDDFGSYRTDGEALQIQSQTAWLPGLLWRRLMLDRRKKYGYQHIPANCIQFFVYAMYPCYRYFKHILKAYHIVLYYMTLLVWLVPMDLTYHCLSSDLGMSSIEPWLPTWVCASQWNEQAACAQNALNIWIIILHVECNVCAVRKEAKSFFKQCTVM